MSIPNICTLSVLTSYTPEIQLEEEWQRPTANPRTTGAHSGGGSRDHNCKLDWRKCQHRRNGRGGLEGEVVEGTGRPGSNEVSRRLRPATGDRVQGQVPAEARGPQQGQELIVDPDRTGAIGLRNFLFKQGVPDVPTLYCGCGEGRETVEHL